MNKFQDFLTKHAAQIQMITGITLGLSSVTFGTLGYWSATELRGEELAYEQQAQRLNQISQSLSDLSSFVEQQQDQLRISQETIANLEEERSRLKPIVEADRQIVEAVLQARHENERRDIWSNRLIGFLLGIAGSLIASAIWSFSRGKAT